MVPTQSWLDDPHSIPHFEWGKRAVLVADVVESVRLMEQDEAGVISRWLALVEHVKTQLLSACGGRYVKSLGDGMLLEFEDVRSAVSAALAIQHESSRRNAHIPAERKILLRIGIEVSDVVIEDDDVYGRGVNRAARLAMLAGPGEIVISAGAQGQLTPVLDADVEDLGNCFLRHLTEPVRAYRVGPPGPRPVITPAAPTGALAPVIAIIPFASRQSAVDHYLLGEVLAEETIRALSASPDLHVISRLSTTAFRGRAWVLDEIAAHLRADYVLSGWYSSDASDVTLDLELAEAKSGTVLRALRLKGRIASVLSADQELIARIVAEIEAGVMTREVERSRSQPLPTLKSYTLLIAAIALMHRLTLPEFEQARHLLQTLIDRQSRQAIPQALLAKWHVLRVQQGWSVDRQQDAFEALECSKRALDADPRCSLALAMDGLVHTNLLRRLDVAQERYEYAIAVNPSDSLAWLLKGTLHAFKGEGEQAVADTDRALKLSPLDPHRYFYDSLAATAALAAHRFDDALALAQRSLRANRTHASTLRVLAIAQWLLGREDEARETGRELIKLEPSLTVGRWLARSPSEPYAIGKEWADVLRRVGVPE